MSFFRSPKMWKSRGERSGLYGGCLSVSQPNIWSLSLTKLAVQGTGVIMIPSDSIQGHFDFMARSSTLSLQETNHTSLLFFASPSFPMLYTTLVSRAIKKQLCVHVRFTLHASYPTEAVSIHNSVASFCEECVLWRVFGFHLTAPYILYAREIEQHWNPVHHFETRCTGYGDNNDGICVVFASIF